MNKILNECKTKSDSILDDGQFPDLPLAVEGGDHKKAASSVSKITSSPGKKPTLAKGVKKNYAEALKEPAPPKPGVVLVVKEAEKTGVSTDVSVATVGDNDGTSEDKRNDARDPYADENNTTLSAHVNQLSLE